MKKIILHGILKKYFCNEFYTKVETLKDIFKVLYANFPNYDKKIKQIHKKCSGLLLVIDNKMYEKDIDDLDENLYSAETIEIIPCSKLSIFTGIAALLVSIGVQAIVAKVIAFVLVIAISIGISFLVSSLLRPGDPKQLKTSSYIFSSNFNISSRNTPIPLNYGRLKIGSSVIGASLFSFDLEYDNKLSTSITV